MNIGWLEEGGERRGRASSSRFDFFTINGRTLGFVTTGYLTPDRIIVVRIYSNPKVRPKVSRPRSNWSGRVVWVGSGGGETFCSVFRP